MFQSSYKQYFVIDMVSDHIHEYLNPSPAQLQKLQKMEQIYAHS